MNSEQSILCALSKSVRSENNGCSSFARKFFVHFNVHTLRNPNLVRLYRVYQMSTSDVPKSPRFVRCMNIRVAFIVVVWTGECEPCSKDSIGVRFLFSKRPEQILAV